MSSINNQTKQEKRSISERALNKSGGHKEGWEKARVVTQWLGRIVRARQNGTLSI